MGVTDLPDDLQKKLAGWEANRPENRSIRVLEDIAAMTGDVIGLLDDQKKDGSASVKSIGAVLIDIRESLVAIKSKEDPKMPDYSKPLLAGLEKLEKAFSKIDIRPVFEPEFHPNISVNSPDVNVKSEVDLKGVEEVLRTDIPKAFKDAVGLIPQTPAVELSPVENLLRQMSEQLESIDTASRMKPQFPNTLKVTNPDGSLVGSDFDDPALAVRIDDVSTADTTYIGKAEIGSLTSTPTWQIAKLDTSSGLIKTWADGSASFNQIWDDRATIIYS